jgi:sugar phosphate isomerase/epimerase
MNTLFRIALDDLDAVAELEREAPGSGIEIYLSAADLEKDDNLKRLQDLARVFRVYLHAPFYDLNIVSQDAFIKKYSCSILQRAYRWGEKIGSEIVVMHLNCINLFFCENPELWLQGAANFFRKILSRESSTLIALENSTEALPDAFLKLREMVADPRLMICFDTGYLNVFGRENLRAWLEVLLVQDRLHLHLHDNDGKADLRLPVGMGNFNWLFFLSRLRRTEIKLSFTLENKTMAEMLASRSSFLGFWKASADERALLVKEFIPPRAEYQGQAAARAGEGFLN